MTRSELKVIAAALAYARPAAIDTREDSELGETYWGELNGDAEEISPEEYFDLQQRHYQWEETVLAFGHVFATVFPTEAMREFVELCNT